jgi:RNA polymerase sigma factor (sigma-70 family)
MPATPDTLEALALHGAWVRRLAGRLAADPHTADDLAQETWVAALRRPPPAAHAWRGFLGSILRKRALHERRSAGRRREHEARTQPPGVAPSAAEALQHAELGRELARLAIELEEPFRSAILLRYVSDLPPRAIAEQLGVPVKTVESRLARGQARLRERWMRRYPDGLAALFGLADLSPHAAHLNPTVHALPAGAVPVATVSTLGVLIVNAKLALGALAVAGGGGLLWFAAALLSTQSKDPVSPAAAAAAERLPQHIGDAGADAALAAAPDARVNVAAPQVDPAAPEATAATVPAAQRVLRGRVVDPEGFPRAGVEVAFRSSAGTVSAVSGADGRFELTTARTAGVVAAVDPALENLLIARPPPTSEREVLIVVAPHRALAGIVRTTTGAALPGASVHLEPPPEFRTRFDVVLDASDEAQWSSTTDVEGRFLVERAPILADATVVAELEGYAPASTPAPPAERLDLELVLERPAAPAGALAGRVIDDSGRAVGGALVSLGQLTATSAPDGTFRLALEEGDDSFELVAALAGHLPARLRALADPLTGKPLWPDWIDLTLGGAPLEIAGRVLDAEGRPRAELRIWLADPTSFGRTVEDDWIQLEFLAAPTDSTYGNADDLYSRSVYTDAQGRFRIQGLLERDYRLGLLDEQSLQGMESNPIRAGSGDVEIEFPQAELGRLRGRLLSRGGQPVAGARVRLGAWTFGGVWHARGEIVSDGDGRFVFEEVASGKLVLFVRGDDVVPCLRSYGGLPEGELEIEVEVLCHLKVDLSVRPELADGLRVLDAEGSELSLHEIGAGGVLQGRQWKLVAGRSVTLGVSEAAVTLVLEKGGSEVRRIALHLAPGRLEVVGP